MKDNNEAGTAEFFCWPSVLEFWNVTSTAIYDLPNLLDYDVFPFLSLSLFATRLTGAGANRDMDDNRPIASIVLLCIHSSLRHDNKYYSELQWPIAADIRTRGSLIFMQHAPTSLRC